jgi:hypothetical protein
MPIEIERKFLLANDDLVITDLANADPDMPASPPRIRVFHLEPIGRAGRLEINT